MDGGSRQESRQHASEDAQVADLAFRALCEQLRALIGLDLSLRSPDYVWSRLRPRLQRLGLDSLPAYCRRLARDPGEVEALVELVRNGVSAFFREREQFQALRAVLAQRGPRSILCAGCATGEEAYSIAMEAAEAGRGHDTQVTAVDISPRAIAHALAGVYPAERVAAQVPPPVRARYFRSASPPDGKLVVTPAVRRMVQFQVLNLARDLPALPARFDAIFCRNVLIYFGARERDDLLLRLVRRLAPEGRLFLGYSESLIVCGGERRFGLRTVAPSVHALRGAEG